MRWREETTPKVVHWPFLGITAYPWGWQVRLFGGWLTICWRGIGVEQAGGRRAAWWSRNGGFPCRWSFFIWRPAPGSYTDKAARRRT